jgi:hypothetical protein
MNKAHTSDNSETVPSLDQMFHEHKEQRRQTHRKMKRMSQSESIAWKTKIDLASRVYDILDKPNHLSNEKLLLKMEEEIFSNLSDLEQITYEELKGLHQYIKVINQQIDDLRSNYSNEWDEEEVEFEGASEEDILLEMEADRLYEQSLQRIQTIEESNWKLQLASAFLGQKAKFEEKIIQVDDFRKNGVETIHMPKWLQSFLEKVPYKTLFTPFGVTFLVPFSYREECMKFLGAYYRDTAFTLVFTHTPEKDSTRDILIHESRHNIYNGLGLYSGGHVGYIAQRIKNAIGRAYRFKQLDVPEFFIEQQYNTVVESVEDIGIEHIRENKDEILANFDRLIQWKWATDVHKTRSGMHVLSNAIQQEDVWWWDTKFLKSALKNYHRETTLFYTRLSDYLFIAQASDLLEDTRKMIYLIDLKDYPLIEWFIKSRIGKRRYEVLRSVRRTIDPNGLKHLIYWWRESQYNFDFGPSRRTKERLEAFLKDPRKFDPNGTIAPQKYEIIRHILAREEENDTFLFHHLWENMRSHKKTKE